jgi:ADP-ribose pyrophosphatase YjhB (NUDIX family)
MNFEPEKFFIGLIDFFSILMPGALLTYLGKDWFAQSVLDVSFALDSVEAGLVFLFCSYLLGHLAFLFGSFLDDWIYGPIRGATPWGQVRDLAKGEELASQRIRKFSVWLFGKDADASVMQAERLKARALEALSAGRAINTFQWCKARLSIENPSGQAIVQRFEADSKFFRSFVVALAALAFFYAFRCMPYQALGCVVAIMPALWRYADLRFKATQHAYWFVITLDAKKEVSRRPKSSCRVTHAGGVVYQVDKQDEDLISFLLVQGKHESHEWVLPQGRIKSGESPTVAAAREVYESTGVLARIESRLAKVSNALEGGTAYAEFYLMQSVEQGDLKEVESTFVWLPTNEAIGRATVRQSKELLELAANTLKKKTPVTK